MRHLALFLLTALLPTTALAQQSTFRLTGIRAENGRSVVTMAYENNWGSDARNVENQKVELFDKVNGGDKVSHGTFNMLGRGMLDVPIDNTRLGLKGGEKITVAGKWTRSGHIWGESRWGSDTRPAGELVVPQGQGISNSRFSTKR